MTSFQSLNNPNDVKSNDNNNEYDEEDSNVTTESNPTEITFPSIDVPIYPEIVEATSESVPCPNSIPCDELNTSIEDDSTVEHQFSSQRKARIDIVLQRIKDAIRQLKSISDSRSDSKPRQRSSSWTSRIDAVLQRIQIAINAIQLQAQEPPKPPIDDTPLHKRSSHIIADNAFVTSHVLSDSIRVTVISHAIVRCIEEIFRAWMYVHHVFSYITRYLLGLKSASSTIAHVDPLLT